jgi:hypothetical protein
MPDRAAPAPPAALHQYLARHGFAPHPGTSAWLDRDTGPQIIRVCHHPGEATLLYCLTPNAVCLYEAVFSPGTPRRPHRRSPSRTPYIPPPDWPGIDLARNLLGLDMITSSRSLGVGSRSRCAELGSSPIYRAPARSSGASWPDNFSGRCVTCGIVSGIARVKGDPGGL